MSTSTSLPSPVNDQRRSVVIFHVDAGKKRINCAISWEALEDHFGADFKDYLLAFTENRKAIEGKAKRLIQRLRFETDGSILMRSSDF
ncbi:MAG: DUF1488 domain-containing protein [Candidatus Competibacteraceae bacterium]